MATSDTSYDEAVWKHRWSEEEADDLLDEEETNNISENGRKHQNDVKEKGMLQVRTQEDWKDEIKEHIQNARDENADVEALPFDRIIASVKKAGKATCYVQRKHNGEFRIKFHKEQIKYAKTDEIKKYHENRLTKLRSGRGGAGTGVLISPKSQLGWHVITNNHVIMDEIEANEANVVFDYVHDFSKEGTKTFKVSKILSKSLRTSSMEDYKTLDYSLLLLNTNADNDTFLKNHALMFDESTRFQAGGEASILKMVDLESLPLIAFSHPHGLAKRLSIGTFPKNGLEKYPVDHIRHSLSTTPGSSGASLLFSSVEDTDFTTWVAAFLHYRANRAVAWQAIAPNIREQLPSN